MPRVLRVITRLNRGGPLRQLEALAPGLASLGWEGPVLAGRVESHEEDGSGDLEAAGAQVVRLPSLARGIDPGADGRAARELSGWIRRTRPDVVHTHTAKAGAIGRLAASLAGVPAVHTFHGHHFDAGGAKGRLARAAERALAPMTAAAIALSPLQRRDLVERHHILPADRVAVVGPGIDVARFRARASAADTAAARAAAGAEDRPFFVWAGRLVPVKDPLLLLEAVRLSTSRFALALLGDGPLRAAAQAKIRESGLSSRVVLLGAVPDTAPWIAAADALVSSSRSEGTPIAILEARALGRPVAATAVGGVPDLVTDGVEGLLVPSQDAAGLAGALDRLASDADLRARLGAAAGRGALERFGRERLARETADLYERVLSGGRGYPPPG